MIRAVCTVIAWACCFVLWLICLCLIPLIYWGVGLWPWR